MAVAMRAADDGKLETVIAETAAVLDTDPLHAEAYFVRGLAQLASEDAADELCVIGGGEVFAMTLPSATRMHLTWVDTVVEGADAFFPRFDRDAWMETAREARAADARHAFAFDFVDYRRL